MGQGKIPQYSHRLMHQKRVTCELHDSYFRLMTIKHAIPRTVEVTHPDGQLWGDIEWVIELLYNSVKTESQLVLETSWWEDAGMRTCPREAGPPGPRLSSPGEWEQHTAMSGGAGEVNMLQFCSVSNSLSHITLSIKWEVYFF